VQRTAFAAQQRQRQRKEMGSIASDLNDRTKNRSCVNHAHLRETLHRSKFM
jgi:hypothetical protein